MMDMFLITIIREYRNLSVQFLMHRVIIVLPSHFSIVRRALFCIHHNLCNMSPVASDVMYIVHGK